MSEKPQDLSRTFLLHHHKQIFSIGEMIDTLLTKLESMGFTPYEVYYAYMEHLYFQRFMFEDADAEKPMQIIDKEVFEHMADYRKKNPKEKRAERDAMFTCDNCKKGNHQHKNRCGILIRKNESGIHYTCGCMAPMR